MAVSRGGVAFWVGCVRGRGGRPPVRRSSWTGGQVLDGPGPGPGPTRPLSGAVWALAPPNSLRYQTVRQPALCRPLPPPGRPRGRGRPGPEDEWPDSLSVCVLVRPGDGEGGGAGLHTLLEIPLFPEDRPPDPDPDPDPDLSFPMTTVDGCRPDDISVETLRTAAAAGSFRSLFQAEGCPAPYVHGSAFYCFHCPAPRPGWDHNLALTPETPRPRPASVSLCDRADPAPGGRAEQDRDRDRDRDGEQDLELVFERLRLELPGFFTSNHDYSMYSPDLEFINGLLNVRTRGRLLYQLTLSLWRLVCLCYFAEARLDVLKLTKHPEDGTVRARWRVRGLPFHRLLLRFYRRDKSHLYRSYDAFSTFYVGQDGLIHCHRVDKVMPAPPPALPRVTSLLAGALVALGVQEPRPALNLLPLLLSSPPGVRPSVLAAAEQEGTARDKGADGEPGSP